MSKSSLFDKALSKITYDDNDCWVWGGRMASSHPGVPTINYKGQQINVRRLLFKEYREEDIEFLQVRRTCNNRRCVNPDHLETSYTRGNSAYDFWMSREFGGVLESIWSKHVEKNTDCWPWVGTLSSQGYPIFYSTELKRTFRAHRIIYEMFYQDRLEPDEIVRHSCDNPRCVNPRHLEKGKCADNADDMMERDRKPPVFTILPGVNASTHPIIVRAIHQAKGTMSASAASRTFNVNYDVVKGIWKGTRFTSLTKQKEVA